MLPNINSEVCDTVLCSSDRLQRFRIRPISLHGNFVIRIEREREITKYQRVSFESGAKSKMKGKYVPSCRIKIF
jgi:hypothetical protein